MEASIHFGECMALHGFLGRSTVLEGGDSRPLVMPDTGAPDSAVQDAITDPFDIMPDEDEVNRCEHKKIVTNVTTPAFILIAR